MEQLRPVGELHGGRERLALDHAPEGLVQPVV
jgi:hypothetical protein